MRKSMLAVATSAGLLTSISGSVLAVDTVAADGSSLANSALQLAQVTSVSELSRPEAAKAQTENHLHKLKSNIFFVLLLPLSNSISMETVLSN